MVYADVAWTISVVLYNLPPAHALQFGVLELDLHFTDGLDARISDRKMSMNAVLEGAVA